MSILRPSLPLRALLALIVAALLCAQLAGVRHRVEHAAHAGVPAAAAGDHHAADGFGRHAADAHAGLDHDSHGEHGSSSLHNCAAFDAAMLGDGPPNAAPATALAPDGAARFGSTTPCAVARTTALGYLSRAPPRA
jgi:hypothetical protein